MGHSLRFLFLFLLVAAAFLLGDVVPYKIRSFCYALSLSIKEVLVFILPWLVYSILFHSTSNLHGANAVKTSLLLMAMVLISNTTSVGISHLLGMYVVNDIVQHGLVAGAVNARALAPAYNTFALPQLISCTTAMVLGFLSGVVLPRIFGNYRVQVISKKLYSTSVFALEKAFAPVLPLFIVGFTFKIHSDGALDVLKNNYQIMLCTLVPACTYVLLLYFLGSGFSVKKTATSVRRMLPAALTGFATMSSLLAMPLTLAAVKKNTGNSGVADIAVPGSVNIHLVGDCFFTVVLLLLLASAFGTAELITASDYAHFLLYVVLMKFAEAAVAGTGLLLMFPTMEQYLHFTPVMLSLSTTLYILMDPVITVVNIMGNGAFSAIFIKVNRFLFGEGSDTGKSSPCVKSPH